MATTLASPQTENLEPRIVLHGIRWEQYATISDALGGHASLRVVFHDGRMTLLSPSRTRDWFEENLGLIVVAVANGLGITLEPAGHATYRLEDLDAGVEGDKTYYVGPHAELMRGPRDIDLTTQPPPDLAIEVEHTHSANDAVAVWARLGTPEVWRFEVKRRQLRFLSRRDDGTYTEVSRSVAIPELEPADLLLQLSLAESLGFSPWFAQLADWVRDVILPRRDK